MRNKTTIIAIVGPSGCGKTTLSMSLQEYCDIQAICSYTTRPMRPGERNGREHWFVGHNLRIPKNPLAYTFFGGHHYWTETYQVDGLGLCTYVIDEKGLIELKEKWGDRYNVVSVYINRDVPDNIDCERRERDNGRIVIEDYDVVLHNNGTEKDLLRSAIIEIGKFLTNHGSTEN